MVTGIMPAVAERAVKSYTIQSYSYDDCETLQGETAKFVKSDILTISGRKVAPFDDLKKNFEKVFGSVTNPRDKNNQYKTARCYLEHKDFRDPKQCVYFLYDDVNGDYNFDLMSDLLFFIPANYSLGIPNSPFIICGRYHTK